jgi:hypothetical protein
MTGVSRRLAGCAILAILSMIAVEGQGAGASNEVVAALTHPKGDLVSHVFRLEPGTMLWPCDDEYGLQIILGELGVGWPAGSTMRYGRAEGVLSVRNTKANIDRLQELLSACDYGRQKQVAVEFQMVAFPAVEVEKLARTNGVSMKSLMALWSTGSGQLIACPQLTMRSGNEGTVRGVRELIYPTEFGGVWIDGTNATFQGSGEAIPGNFETREAGAIVSVIPEIAPEGDYIQLNLRPEWVGLTDWIDYGTEGSGTGTNRLPMRQPVFYRHAVEAMISLAPGSRVLLGGGVPGPEKDTLVFTFVTARFVSMEGKPLETLQSLLRHSSDDMQKPPSTPKDHLSARIFHPYITGGCYIKSGDSEEQGPTCSSVKDFLTTWGVTWPAGSTVSFWQAERVLSVVNTASNLALVQSFMECNMPKQVEIDMQMVAFQAVEIEKLAIRNGISLESLMALWSTGAGKLVACQRVISRSGNEATVRGVKELIYPTDFGRSGVNVEGTNMSGQPGGDPIPQNFETREVGAIFSVIPEVSPESDKINLNLRPEWVGMPEWVDYGTEGAGAATNRLPMRQPVFYRHSVETQFSLARGAKALLGGGVTGPEKDTLIFTFVRACLVDGEGNPIPEVGSLREQIALPAKAP